MLTRARIAAVALSVIATSPPAPHAEPRTSRVVAIAPLSTMGAEDTSASTLELAAELERAFARLPGARVVTTAQVTQAIQRAKKPRLRVCERDTECLAELGRLVGATIVIDGEVGGLGDSRIVYLGATDVSTGKEIRSTTLSIGDQADPGGGAEGAAVRLLEPERYRGVLEFEIDVTGATVYVNGSQVALSPNKLLSLPVGTHAVRVTHPEYRDFVRFIDVPYAGTLEVPVAMQQYPILKRDLQGKPVVVSRSDDGGPPVWRRWYVVGPVALGLAIATGIVVGHLVHDFPSGDVCRKGGGGTCE